MNSMMDYFKLYTRQAYYDLEKPQLCQLFLYTNDPTYGAMVEAREVGDASVKWMTQGRAASMCVESFPFTLVI